MHTINYLESIYFEEDVRVNNLIMANQLGLSIPKECAKKVIKDSNRNLKKVVSFFKSQNVNLK